MVIDIFSGIEPLTNWAGNSATNGIFLIAGPCSAESPEQLDKTIQGIKEHLPQVLFVRAGVWKPRTRPGEFSGVGVPSLAWMSAMRDKHQIKILCEVACREHVEAALNVDVDAVWIGARTTVNPFMVQEIADALKGFDGAVLVKNPVGPDLKLWMGGIERILRAGIGKVAALHRGFSVYGTKRYRNDPCWQIPIELRRLLPNLPIICDPSHIAGTRALLHEVSQCALDLGFDGLMIETHYDPDIALSDAKQQVTPLDLKELIASLKLRRERTESEAIHMELEQLRKQIDQIDQKLIQDLSLRQSVVDAIAALKNKNDLTAYQSQRWSQMLESRLEQGAVSGLDAEQIRAVFAAIHQAALRRQDRYFNESSAFL